MQDDKQLPHGEISSDRGGQGGDARTRRRTSPARSEEPSAVRPAARVLVPIDHDGLPTRHRAQISSVTPGLGTGGSAIGPHVQGLGEGVELGVERLLPGDGLAGVGRHPAHDGRQRALGDLLQLVDRLVGDDALEQVDVLLDVGVDLVLDADATSCTRR